MVWDTLAGNAVFRIKSSTGMTTMNQATRRRMDSTNIFAMSAACAGAAHLIYGIAMAATNVYTTRLRLSIIAKFAGIAVPVGMRICTVRIASFTPMRDAGNAAPMRAIIATTIKTSGAITAGAVSMRPMRTAPSASAATTTAATAA